VLVCVIFFAYLLVWNSLVVTLTLNKKSASRLQTLNCMFCQGSCKFKFGRYQVRISWGVCVAFQAHLKQVPTLFHDRLLWNFLHSPQVKFRIFPGYWQDGWGSIPGRSRDFFSLPHRVQTGSGAHPFSYPMYTAWEGLWISLHTYLHIVPRLRIRGAIRQLPHTPSWRDA
jgi:hypothetical protein